jgi:hypothetical protein
MYKQNSTKKYKNIGKENAQCKEYLYSYVRIIIISSGNDKDPPQGRDKNLFILVLYPHVLLTRQIRT